MAFYYLDIGGTRYEFSHLEYEREASLESKTLVATIKIAGPRTPALGDTVTVTRDSNNAVLEKWRGKLERIQEMTNERGTYKILAYDLKRKINYIAVPDPFAWASQKGSATFVILRDPASATDLLNTGTVDTTDPTLDSVDFGKSANSAFMRKDAMDILQMISDRDIHIERDGKANFLNGAGTDRSTTHVFEHGKNCQLDPEMGFVRDQTRRVKRVTVKGKGVGTQFVSGAAQAGGYTTNDKIRQLELPFLVSAATCNLVAANVLAELDKEIKYAKVTNAIDLFRTGWDVFDTVKLKADLTDKIDENLKVFSIRTVVSGDREQFENVTVTLSNFRRAIWARLVDPVGAAEGNDAIASLSLGSTQLQNQILTATIQETVTAYQAPEEVDASGWASINSVTFNSTKTQGAYLIVDIGLTPMHNLIDATSVLLFRVSDGVSILPVGEIRTTYESIIGKNQLKQITIFIPENTEGMTYTLQARAGSGGRLGLGSFITAYSVGY